MASMLATTHNGWTLHQSANNLTGYKGVKMTLYGTYYAVYNKHYLGAFDTAVEAAEAYAKHVDGLIELVPSVECTGCGVWRDLVVGSTLPADGEQWLCSQAGFTCMPSPPAPPPPPPPPPAPSAFIPAPLSDYEIKRLAAIAKNNAKLVELGLM